MPLLFRRSLLIFQGASTILNVRKLSKLLIRAILFEGEKIILRPTNPKYKDIVTERGDERLCVLGKVIAEVPGIRKLTGLW